MRYWLRVEGLCRVGPPSTEMTTRLQVLPLPTKVEVNPLEPAVYDEGERDWGWLTNRQERKGKQACRRHRRERQGSNCEIQSETLQPRVSGCPLAGHGKISPPRNQWPAAVHDLSHSVPRRGT